jgi:hypothetical protein
VRVGSARSAAARWVGEHTHQAGWFQGAFFSGSTAWLPEDTELPAGSDVDVMIVTTHDDPPPKLGKFRYQGTLIEVTYLSWRLLASAEQVLADYHLAGCFRAGTDPVIADPTGRLRSLHQRVARGFAEPAWVRRRCQQARSKILNGLEAIDPSAPWHDQVTTWLFATSVTTHVLLVAARRNPTVRLRYQAARQVLTDYGQAGHYPQLLRLLGCAQLTQRQVAQHLRGLARTFDAAAEVATTPFFFSTDITALARPVAIDASQRLVDGGDHREAVFWIVATFARCHKIMAADAPHLEHELAPAFQAMMADLGITSTEDLLRRAEQTTRFLPTLWETAETILSADSGTPPQPREL